jgi:hypothetical protein
MSASTMHAAYPTLPTPAGPLTDFSLPWRTLAGWTLVVLLAHWALLGGAADLWPHWQDDHSTGASALNSGTFVTRTIPWVAPTPTLPKESPRVVTSFDGTSSDVAGPTGDIVPTIGYEDSTPESDATPEPEEPTPPPLNLVGGTADDGSVFTYAIPSPVILKYDIKGEVKGFPYRANAELQWRHDGKAYDARMEISHFLLGSRVQTSKGQLTLQGLEPSRFGDKFRSEVAAHFEREKGKVSFSANTPDAALTPGAQDHLSVFMQLAALIGGNPTRLQAGSTLTFQAIGSRSSEIWVFKIGAQEMLRLPGGDLTGIKVLRDPVNENDARAELWLVPTLGYLPARIRLTQSNGDFVDQLWRSAQNP